MMRSYGTALVFILMLLPWSAGAHDYGALSGMLSRGQQLQLCRLALTLAEAGYRPQVPVADAASRPGLGALVEAAFSSDDAAVIAEIEAWIEQSELRTPFAPVFHYAFMETLLELAQAYDQDLEHAAGTRHLEPEVVALLEQLHAVLATAGGSD